jgi:hypothetical protein
MKRFSKDKEEVAKFRRQLEQVVQEFQVGPMREMGTPLTNFMA